MFGTFEFFQVLAGSLAEVAVVDAHGASIGGVEPADALLELWKCLQWEELLKQLARLKRSCFEFSELSSLQASKQLQCSSLASSQLLPRSRQEESDIDLPPHNQKPPPNIRKMKEVSQNKLNNN